jgi:hypothetical protein
MMLDRPYRVESEWLGHLGKPQFIAVNLGVGKGVVGILESCSVAYVHDVLLCILAAVVIRVRPWCRHGPRKPTIHLAQYATIFP